ncbi:hypothetical protein H4Q32_028855 [Labeo rohita]|uniref:Reverse transcriptase domain-containing protein n=1 Tax=Labeo rohita TaxID=84645 RepID=A0ABQ8L5X2_LABRO|nr:hypothetical protein H4Q32_028855 [Labeo rohita]
MAPLCLACHLLLCFLLFVLAVVSPAIVYDRTTLLELRFASTGLLNAESFKLPPPLLTSIPPPLRRPVCLLSGRKRRRRRGRRGGLHVRLRTYLDSPPLRCGDRLELGSAGRSRECYRWLRLVGPDTGVLSPCPRRGKTSTRCCVQGNLRPIPRVTSPPVNSTSFRMALCNTRSLNNKTFVLNDAITSHNLDLFFLTETWLCPGDDSAFSELLPFGYFYFNTPRQTGRGGGIATIFRQSLKCRQLSTRGFSSFELQAFVLTLPCPILCVIIYRPPKLNKDFLNDFSEFLSEFMPKFDNILICGDFNIHVCCPSDKSANDFKALLHSLDLTQSISCPTHRLGHTLDLIISRGVTVSICEVLDFPVSDHSLIRFDIRAAPPAPTSTAPQRRRIITSSTVDDFVAAFTASDLCSAADLASPLCPDLFLSSFHTICSQIMDSVAPYKVMGTKSPSDPWLNDTTRALRRRCRQAECKWKKDRLQVSLEMFRDSLSTYQRAVKEAKGQYLSNLINSNSHRPGILFSTINSVINPVFVGLNDVSEDTCSAFKQYFLDKVLSVRQAITQVPAVVIPSQAAQCVLENFETVTLMDLKKAVHELKATICPLDAVPAMKEAIDIVGPCLVSFINSCLSLGTVPTALKHAIVRPLLKKPNLDPSILSNFRPISHLPFLSKLMEKLVVSQLQSHLQLHAIADKFQSGFRSRHSTESALLRVHNDILGALDCKSSVVLVLLDLTAAFDTVDHAVLISRLQHIVGLQGMVLRWFSSYLTNRTFSVMLNDFFSSPAPLLSGVPQGSILGPILFSLYMLPLGQLISNYNVRFHFYADDLQIYLPMVLSNRSALDPLHNCIRNIRQWLSQNFLHLNEGKTDGMIFGKQISAVVKASFYQLRLLSKVKPFLSRADLEKAVHAFISSRIDYCNALYTGLNQSLLNRLQLVQNAAARLLSNTSKRSHISPVLRSLHWLPVRFRVKFKILMFVFKAINGLAPVYLAELVMVYQPARTLRSSEHTALVMPKFNYKKFGGWSFAIQGPKLWNALPEQLRNNTDLCVFKSQLKTHLFRQAFDT